MKKYILAIVALGLITSCSSVKSVKNTDTTIETTIDLNNVVDDRIEVVVNPKKIKQETITYQIPAIVPGTYAISDYGQFITNFKAFDYDGELMTVTKVDTNSWKIENAKKLDKVSYLVDDTFDSKKKHNIYVMAGTNIEKDRNFLLNLPGFVGYFKGKKELKYRVTVKHPKNLYETSSLINKNTTKESNTEDVFLASRYDEISDNPIMYAPLNTISFTIDGIAVTLSVYSPNNIHSAKDLEEPLKKMVQAQCNFLKGFKTTNEYNILVYLFDSKVYNWQSFGALEHNSSTTVVYPESYSKEQLANGMLNGTVSHEFFHIVTPLSVHSEEIHSFDFNKPNMSKHLWMYEGITEYFANLFQVNQGLITEQEFINKMEGKIKTSKYYDDTMSFTIMSKNILDGEYAKNYNNVYQKGALIAMTLDIILREETKGKYGIRDLMKDLSNKYGKDKPFKDDEIIADITKMTNPKVGDFFKKHIEGTTPIDYDMYFEKVGVSKGENINKTSYFLDHKNRPFISVNKEKQVFIVTVNSGLKALGVQKKDILKSINNEEVTLATIRLIIGKTMVWKPGDAINMEVIRDGKTIKLSGKAIVPTFKIKSLKLDKLPVTNAKVVLRNAWLKN